jgi:hypothetical protein
MHRVHLLSDDELICTFLHVLLFEARGYSHDEVVQIVV